MQHIKCAYVHKFVLLALVQYNIMELDSPDDWLLASSSDQKSLPVGFLCAQYHYTHAL